MQNNLNLSVVIVATGFLSIGTYFHVVAVHPFGAVTVSAYDPDVFIFIVEFAAFVPPADHKYAGHTAFEVSITKESGHK